MANEIETFDASDPSSHDPALKRILNIKQRVTASDPRSIPPDRNSIASSLFRSNFTSTQRTFCTDAATVTARVSPTLKDLDGNPIGTLGFFDSENEIDAVRKLLAAASEYLLGHGCRSIVGPIDGDTWHKYRINVGPLGGQSDWPFLLEPHNPDYYQRMFIDSGFEVVSRYHSRQVDNLTQTIAEMKPSFEAAAAAGYTLRPFAPDAFEQELKVIYDLSTRCFSGNFLYEHISQDEFIGLYANAKKITRERLVWFAMDPKKNEVGFLFALPDCYRPIHSMRGKQNWLAKAKFAMNLLLVKAVNFKSIAVLPEHRRNRLAGAMMYQAYVESHKMGFAAANLCLIRDGNHSEQLDGGNSRLLRRYELYQTPGSRLIDFDNDR